MTYYRFDDEGSRQETFYLGDDTYVSSEHYEYLVKIRDEALEKLEEKDVFIARLLEERNTAQQQVKELKDEIWKWDFLVSKIFTERESSYNHYVSLHNNAKKYLD